MATRAEKMVEDIFKWLNTPQGKAQLKKAGQEAKAAAEPFRKMRKVSHERLHRRFDI